MSRTSAFPQGAATGLDELEGPDPHPHLARLRGSEPVSWMPALEGWLVTAYEPALAVLRDARTFTVDDPRFSTSQILGPSMLSLDGAPHDRHRAPFAGPFRAARVHERFAAAVSDEVDALIDELAPAGAGDLRRPFAGALAAATVTRALGMDRAETEQVLRWYDAIVAGVTEITRGGEPPARAADAFAGLRRRLLGVIDADAPTSLLAAAARGSGLNGTEISSNAAVLLFGGIETTEGMIANALLILLADAPALDRVRAEPALIPTAIEESLRLEPAGAAVDRYATRDARLCGADIARGELVRVSITAANRDPDVFAAPDRLDLDRTGARRHLAFAQGPHVCLGVHLARLEARTALKALLARLGGLRLDPARPASIRGLVFRKPPELHALWDSAAAVRSSA